MSSSPEREEAVEELDEEEMNRDESDESDWEDEESRDDVEEEREFGDELPFGDLIDSVSEVVVIETTGSLEFLCCLLELNFFLIF